MRFSTFYHMFLGMPTQSHKKTKIVLLSSTSIFLFCSLLLYDVFSSTARFSCALCNINIIILCRFFKVFSCLLRLFLFHWQAIWMTCALSAIGLDFCYRIFPFLRNSSLAHVQSENRRLMMVNRVSYTAYT